MKIFCSLNDFLRYRRSSGKVLVTIGVFDGVHKAHRKIIKTLVKKAKSSSLPSAVITFDPHPMNVLNLPGKRVPLLISLKHRLCIFKEMGIDYAIVLPFNKKLSRMSAHDFIQKILGRINIDEIIVGENFFFGRKKSGSSKVLKRFSRVFGYKVNFVSAVKSSGRIVSSTWIRSLILEGNLRKASRLLSGPVTVLGTVVKGTRKGRILGYPTANIDPHHEAIPPSGVYVIKVKLQNGVYGGILNIGIKPTFAGSFSPERDPTIEAHIFDFNKRIYGKDIEVVFVRKIRKERRFKDARTLRAQIAKDEKLARRVLN